MTGNFANRVVLITGGGAGIGRATTLKFVAAGASVVIAEIDAAAADECAALARGIGGELTTVRANVASARDVAELVRATVARFGRLDAAFNNAAIGTPASLKALGFGQGERFVHNYPEAAFDLIMNVNLKGVFLCMQSELGQMLTQGSGVIVNAASFGGLRGVANGAAGYIASKHGVIGLTRAAALEYADKNIRINAICPGVIKTDMLASLSASAQESLAAKQPNGRLGTPEEVAELVYWLCSDASSFVTGQALSIDGGLTAA